MKKGVKSNWFKTIVQVMYVKSEIMTPLWFVYICSHNLIAEKYILER
jgi:hypothetical protein